MKKIWTITFIFISSFIHTQELPSIPAKGFSFPLGSRFVIKLTPTDSVKFDYSVQSLDLYEEIVDTENMKDLFEENEEEDIIVFYFVIATSGDTEEEREKNMRVRLLMKNYSNESLEYISDIQREENGHFEETSNIGILPKVIGSEIWPYYIYTIGLRDFKKANYNIISTKTINSDSDNIFLNRFNLLMSDLGQLKFSDVRIKEQEWGGIDDMPNYNIGIGESYYPNPNKYELDTFRVYVYKSPLIENTITYFGTKQNRLIRVISLEWEEPFLISQNMNKSATDLFQKKSNLLESTIGQRTRKNIKHKNEENYTSQTWQTPNGHTILLEKAKNFNKIRMMIYKD